jgi:hypothetical protein
VRKEPYSTATLISNAVYDLLIETGDTQEKASDLRNRVNAALRTAFDKLAQHDLDLSSIMQAGLSKEDQIKALKPFYSFVIDLVFDPDLNAKAQAKLEELRLLSVHSTVH